MIAQALMYIFNQISWFSDYLKNSNTHRNLIKWEDLQDEIVSFFIMTDRCRKRSWASTCSFHQMSSMQNCDNFFPAISDIISRGLGSFIYAVCQREWQYCYTTKVKENTRTAGVPRETCSSTAQCPLFQHYQEAQCLPVSGFWQFCKPPKCTYAPTLFIRLSELSLVSFPQLRK